METEIIDKLYDVEVVASGVSEQLDELIGLAKLGSIILAAILVLFICFCLHH